MVAIPSAQTACARLASRVGILFELEEHTGATPGEYRGYLQESATR